MQQALVVAVTFVAIATYMAQQASAQVVGGYGSPSAAGYYGYGASPSPSPVPSTPRGNLTLPNIPNASAAVSPVIGLALALVALAQFFM